MRQKPSTAKRCQILLNEWRQNLTLTRLERVRLSGELKVLDRQLWRLQNNLLRVAAFGRVGVGKSSLLNALIGQSIFNTDVAHGCTRRIESVEWEHPIGNLQKIELLDTPGIDEIATAASARLAARVALQVDLVLLVIDSDITRIELEALQTLLKSGKPILLVLNRCDQWDQKQLKELEQSIKSRLPMNAHKINLHMVAAAPRKAHIQSDGKIRSQETAPRIKPLKHALIKLLNQQGELFLGINALRQAISFDQSLKAGRLHRRKICAQGIIGKFAALKASAVAANPFIFLDLAGGLVCDTALVMELSKLYELEMEGYSARKLIKRLTMQNALLGGAQISIQLFLGLMRHILILMTPLTGGISMATAGPVAIAQAALAVHTTKTTGKLAAETFLHSKQKHSSQPDAMLRRLAMKDPDVKNWITSWPKDLTLKNIQIQTLLP